jgi:hypothetical protein
MALGAAGSQGVLANNAANTSNFYLGGDIWNPASNPNLRGAIDAAVRPITEQYQQTVLPGIRDNFAGAQPFGGSRRGVAEGLAANSYMRNVGDASAKIAEDEYGNNLNAQLRALGLLPQTQQAQLAPALTTSGVGDIRQNMAQQLLNMNVGNWNYDQLAPFLQSQELMSLIGGLPGGTTTANAVGSVPGRNPITGAMGGALTGATLGSALLPGVGALPGAGIGALLSFL